jgi:peptidoglycan/xylan/chitin deacetylase (PgdA/CDA1 family)
MIFCATVDDVCLEGYSTEEHMANLLDFYREQQVRATFFTVPRAEGIPLGQRPRYRDLLKQAASEGHAIGQHGLEHDRFETGIPAQIVLDLPHEGPARERLARERAAIEANLGIGPLRERLATGRQILEDALGFEIGGFRAPCLSICDNLFHALEAEQFRYDSSRHFQDAGWDIINNREYEPRPITRERFEQAQYPGAMRTLPLTAEYTWYLPRQKFDITMDLARHDFTACMRAGIPFVPVCHVSPVQQCEDDCGFDFYRQLLDFAREQAAANGEELELLNLAETAERGSMDSGQEMKR